jgi:hypothetical protein
MNATVRSTASYEREITALRMKKPYGNGPEYRRWRDELDELEQLMAKSRLVEAVCPKCGSDRLASVDVVTTFASIIGWEKNSAGKLEPQYAGGSEVLWDSQRHYDPKTPYCCRRCGATFAQPKLKEA